VTPLFFVPFALAYGWRAAFILSAVIGVAWILLWAAIARPPYLAATQAPAKIGWPNLFERRTWALAFSYGPTAISSGPIQAFGALYLARNLHVSQAEIGRIFWIPMFTWALGYYAGGWAADRFCSHNARPVGLFWLCTVLALPVGLTAQTDSVTLAVASISFSTFIAGVFQMIALKVGTHSFPREKTAMMSGIATASWSLLNAGLAPQIGKLFNQNRYDEAFWIVALLPVVGTIGWWLLSSGIRSAQSPSTAPATT
jgi:ACS family hexuronate transporter-like MFS transporter